MAESTHFESLYPAESRFKEIAKAITYIRHGNSCQLIALPGVGRSTFLGLLAYNKAVRQKHLGEDEKRFHFVLTNFSEVRRRSLMDVTKFLFLSLVDSLRDRQFTEEYQRTKALFQEALSMQDELVLFQGLKNAIDVLTAERNMTIVFLFDRFEEYIPMLTADFFANLRVLRNRAKYQFSAIFSLNRPLEDSIEPGLMTEFYDFFVGHHIFLPIQDQAGTTFRISYLENVSQKTFPPKTIDNVMEITGGFSREVKACLQTIATMEVVPSAHEDLVAALLAHKIVQRPLVEMWQTLTPSEQDFLLSNNYPQEDQDYAYLASVGLVKDGVITIPLLKNYLQQLRTLPLKAEAVDTTIHFDAEKNEIRQGTRIISDTLTASEFRLLRFLIEQQDQIIDRETLINAVWKESTSTAGVTDQAVDQLIFRVRKKIEEDPNNPTHLQTVKGRGYKFLP